ncbi:hypothetical protein EUX98_g5034 [Antrodiella citrinella]|uniref:Uncharacterized protein n=1 Tax=Antrodiella citrinella TaxID=2447956 RepID=A0A4S4MVB7_9APHY|nr:hypothetical protein EUX98_g5034 [Antrodiella citrinella]
MTLTILVSFSLLALVVTAHPIELIQDTPLETSGALQGVVQAIFQARASQLPECMTCENEEDIHIQFTSSEEQTDVLSALDDLDAIKGIVPIGLNGVLTDDEKKLYNILGSPRPGAGLDDLEGGESPLLEEMATSQEATSSKDEEDSIQELYTEISHYMPLRQVLTLTFSCLVALLSMGCIGFALYAFHYFWKSAGAETAWELIPRVEARDAVELVVDDDFASQFKGGKPPSYEHVPHRPSTPAIVIDTVFQESSLTHIHPHDLVINLDSDEDSDDEGLDGKFHDAVDRPSTPFRFVDGASPRIPVILVDEHADPDYLPLPGFRSPTPYSTPPPTPPRSPARRVVEMREATLLRPSSPISKPEWSIRAADAPALGLTGSDARTAPVPLPLPIRPRPSAPVQPATMLAIPGSLPLEHEMEMVERPRARRAYRSPIPELDIAFAMQLRPGLGLGADPAWIVRFLMAMFGWMTVLIGNGVPEPVRRDRRAIA